MNKRKLGNSAIEIAPLVFGGNVFGWTLDEKSSFEMLDGLVDMGINMIDTADVYSAWAPGNEGGESETIIGNWLKISGKRDKVVIATKVGMQMGNGSQGLAKKHIIKSAEESLKRLNTDHIDLYYAHKDDESVRTLNLRPFHHFRLEHKNIRTKESARGQSTYTRQLLYAKHHLRATNTII